MKIPARICSTLLAAAALTWLLPASAATVTNTYDLNADWSNSQNPNGAWTYNYNGSPIGTFQMFWWGQPGWGSWSLGEASILKGSQPTGSDPWGNPVGPAHDWQANDVMLHAMSVPYGGDTTFVNVKWTSPSAGVIDITGRAWDGEIFPDRNVSWQLLVNGKAIAQRVSLRGLNRNDKGAPLAANLTGRRKLQKIPVRKGTIVEFRVITESYYGHFVGLEETITLRTKQR